MVSSELCSQPVHLCPASTDWAALKTSHLWLGNLWYLFLHATLDWDQDCHLFLFDYYSDSPRLLSCSHLECHWHWFHSLLLLLIFVHPCCHFVFISAMCVFPVGVPLLPLISAERLSQEITATEGHCSIFRLLVPHVTRYTPWHSKGVHPRSNIGVTLLPICKS